ncbi:MAG TPA: hypothetical protein VEW69_04265, partial [Alphaproteobacteria bacterium]|nr:hypothetical protein [Alphaproteobacteria bacterium]
MSLRSKPLESFGFIVCFYAPKAGSSPRKPGSLLCILETDVAALQTAGERSLVGLALNPSLWPYNHLVLSRRLIQFFLVALIVIANVPAGAQAIQARHARVELLARQTAIAPGSELLLGVRFVLEPGWHIYWINPG